MPAIASRGRRPAIFAAACLAALVVVFGYVALTSPRSAHRKGMSETAAPVTYATTVPDGPVILFRNAAPGELYGRIAVVPLSAPDEPRQIAPISCERVHYAAGSGVCMVSDESRLPI